MVVRKHRSGGPNFCTHVADCRHACRETEPKGLAVQLGEGPPHLLEVHTRLHTRELASFLPSLSLPLWPRVKMRPSEERPRGQSSVSRFSGWLLGRVKGIQDSAPASQVPVLGLAVPLSRLDSPHVMNADLARPPSCYCVHLQARELAQRGPRSCHRANAAWPAGLGLTAWCAGLHCFSYNTVEMFLGPQFSSNKTGMTSTAWTTDRPQN